MSKTLESLRELVRCWACGAWGEVQHMCDYAPKAFDIAYGLQCFLCSICSRDDNKSLAGREFLAGSFVLAMPIRTKRHDEQALFNSIIVSTIVPLLKGKGGAT